MGQQLHQVRLRTASADAIVINFFPGIETPNSMAELDNPLNQNASRAGLSRQSSSESSQKQFSRLVPHLLSPTVEESPPRHEETRNQMDIPGSLLADRDKHDHSPVSYKHLGKASRIDSQWAVDISDAVGDNLPAGLDIDIALGLPLSSVGKDITPSQEAACHDCLTSSRSDTALPHLNRARDTQTVPATWCPEIAIVPPTSRPDTPSIKIQNDPSTRCIDSARQDCLPKSHTEPNISRRTSYGLRLPVETRGHNRRKSRMSTRSPPSQWKSIIPLGNKRQEPSAANSKPTTPDWKRLLHKKSKPKMKPSLSSPENKNENAPKGPNDTTYLTPRRYKNNTTGSPPTGPFTGSHRATSRRSVSKPMPGAVKAMTALFDNSNVGSLGKSHPDPESLANISKHTPHNASSSEQAVHASRTKGHVSRIVFSRPRVQDTPTKLRDTLQPRRMLTTARKEPQASTSAEICQRDRSQPPRLGTMVRHQEEPPIGHFVRSGSAASAPGRHVSISQSMGAITPPHPDSISSLGSRQMSENSNSFLHAQIRNLQRQLEGRNEEVLRLRRQLEAQENKDIGTLCERLRAAKRECLMWRKRAESAERRMAVFHRFASRFQALRDDAFDPVDETPIDDLVEVSDGARNRLAVRSYDEKGDDSMSSSSSVHTETCEALNNRIKQSITVCARTEYGAGGGDGAVVDDNIIEREGDIRGADIWLEGGRDYKLHRASKTTRVWRAARGLLDRHAKEDRKTIA